MMPAGRRQRERDETACDGVAPSQRGGHRWAAAAPHPSQQNAVARRRPYQGRPDPVLPERRAVHAAPSARPAAYTQALPGRHSRRPDLPPGEPARDPELDHALATYPGITAWRE